MRYRIAKFEKSDKESSQTEEGPREPGDIYKQLAESLDELVYRADPKTFVATYVNSSIERIFGYSVEEWLKDPELWEKAIYPEDKERVLAAFTELQKEFKNDVIDYRIVRKDGTVLWVEDRVSWEKDHHGNVVSLAGVMSDITERKKAGEEQKKQWDQFQEQVSETKYLNRAMVNLSEDLHITNASLESLTQQLTDANKELEAFSYSVSHDLRAPLRAIDGFSKILLEDHSKTLGKEGQRILEVVRDNTKYMGKLIDDLLSFSRLGRKEIKTTRIDMGALIKNVQKASMSGISNRQIQWETNKLPPAYGDNSLIRQVIINLLSNAVKFTGSKKAAVIVVGSKKKGKETLYYVKDNGIGFDMKYVGKLFDVFQRLHSSTEFEGTGVGLAIVKRIIQKHGGRVWAEGKVDQGATFYFSIPTKGDK